MTSVEVLDEPDDVAGFKRASEETEARIQTLENTFMHTSYTLFFRIFSSSLPLQELSLRKDPGWRK